MQSQSDPFAHFLQVVAGSPDIKQISEFRENIIEPYFVQTAQP